MNLVGDSYEVSQIHSSVVARLQGFPEAPRGSLHDVTVFEFADVHVDARGQCCVLSCEFGFPLESGLVVPPERRAADNVLLEKVGLMGEDIRAQQTTVGMAQKATVARNSSVGGIDERNEFRAEE